MDSRISDTQNNQINRKRNGPESFDIKNPEW